MIAPNKNQDSPNKKIEDNLQKLLDIIYEEPKYHIGSYHESTNFVELINIAHNLLFTENNESISLIIDRKPCNKIDITIDTIR